MSEIDRWSAPVRGRVPYFSINKRGELAMNRAGHSLINFVYRVSLCYSDERHELGLVYNFSSRPNYDVKKYGRGGNMRVIRIAAALKYFGIHIPETLVFQTHQTHGDRVLALPLSTAIPLTQHREKESATTGSSSQSDA